MEPPGRWDVRSTGIQVEGVGAPQWVTHRNIVVYLPWLQQAKVWSVARGADRRELILIIQTDGPDCKLVLWDHVALLGSTVLRVTFQKQEDEAFESITLIGVHPQLYPKLVLKRI